MYMRNLQEQVKKAFCYQKFFWLRINCSSDLKFSAFSFEFQKFFSISRGFFFTVGQNNFGNKIPFPAENLRVFKNSQHPNGDIVLPRVGEKLLISPLVTQQNISDQTWSITQIDILLHQAEFNYSLAKNFSTWEDKEPSQLLLCSEFCSHWMKKQTTTNYQIKSTGN